MDNGLQAAIAAAQAAGKLLRAGFGRAQKVTHKGEIDIVTEADRAAEARIMELLSAAAPGYGFLTEESGAAAGHTDGRWIIDPLDGTTNYSRGCPRFCVSIALERAGALVLGVIYDPLQGELFVARRGQGATLNGQPIRVSNTNSLARALVSTGYPYDAWTSPRDNTAEAAYMVKHVLSVRCTGSAALDLANVACGRTDAHWEYGLAPYDTAAGVLLVREAGGLATDYAGGPDAVYSREIIAATPAVHAEMLSYLKERHAPGALSCGRRRRLADCSTAPRTACNSGCGRVPLYRA